jgi:restriction endonuclease S subunit
VEDDKRITPFGVIPARWPIEPLDRLAEVQTGVAKGRDLTDAETVEVPYLRVANVQDGYLDLTEMKSIQIRRSEVERYRLQTGDVVLTEGGDFDKLGRGFIWRGELELCIHQNHVFAVRTDRRRLLPEFFAYLAQSPYGKAYFLQVAHKTTNLACINTTKLKAFPIIVPTLEEQRAIARVLDLAAGAANIEKRSERQAQELKRAAMRELFTRGLRGEPQKIVDNKPMPESWTALPVELCVRPLRFERSKQLKSSSYAAHGRWPIVDQGQSDVAGYTDNPEHVIDAGQPVIVFGDHSRTFKYFDCEFALGADGTKPLLATDGLMPKFLYYALCNLDIPNRGYNRHYSVLAPMNIGRPDLGEQREIVAILDAIDRKIDLHKRKRAVLEELFKTLLHKLMTGGIRVCDLDLSALPAAALRPQEASV